MVDEYIDVTENEDSSLETPWFLKEGDELLQALTKRADEFSDVVESNQLARRIVRNLLYYHNIYFTDDIDYLDMDIKALGDEGEIAGISVNHLRALLQALLGFATAEDVRMKAIATNSNVESLEAARLATNVIEHYYKEKDFYDYFRRAAEHALVLTAGYVKITWEPVEGELLRYGENGLPQFKGDIRIENPSIFDVIYDFSVKDWNKNDWLLVKTQRNKYRLMAAFPEHAADIEEATASTSPEDAVTPVFTLGSQKFNDTDFVDCWELYYKKSPEMPEGRFVIFIEDVIIHDGPIPYEDLPVHRMVPNEYLLTSTGYTPAFDLQGIQEAINQEYMTILSNHKSHGLQHIWTSSQDPDEPEVEMLANGLSHIKCGMEPKGLNFTATPAEIFKFADMLVQQAEYVSGVNAVARGQPQPSLKSGTALALVDYKAQQFAAPFIRAYKRLVERSTTSMVKILRSYATNERVITIIGKHNLPSTQYFKGSNLEGAGQVIVESVNPMSATQGFKMELARMLIEMGAVQGVQGAQQILQVLNSGSFEPLVQAETAQLTNIQAENEALMKGDTTLLVDAFDNHILHLQEHSAVLHHPNARNDDAVRRANQLHRAEHMYWLRKDPQTQVALGYATPEQIAAILSTPGVDSQLPPGGEGPVPQGPPIPEGGGGVPANLDQGLGGAQTDIRPPEVREARLPNLPEPPIPQPPIQ